MGLRKLPAMSKSGDNSLLELKTINICYMNTFVAAKIFQIDTL